MSELLRFFAVTVLGVVIDLALAFALHVYAGLPLWLAAALGFTLAAGLNYVIHQSWSFGGGIASLSARRAGLYSGVALVTLLIRTGVVALLTIVLPGAWPLAILIAGAGVSFVVNFVLSKSLVFPSPEGGRP